MQTTTTHFVDEKTPVRGYILTVEGRPWLYLDVGEPGERSTFIIRDAAFLDRLSNEADRLCREAVGDVPQASGTPVSDMRSFANDLLRGMAV